MLEQKAWLTREEMREIYPCGRDQISKMFNQAKEKAIEEDYFIPICRPPVVPTEVVLELFPIGKKKSF